MTCIYYLLIIKVREIVKPEEGDTRHVTGGGDGGASVILLWLADLSFDLSGDSGRAEL